MLTPHFADLVHHHFDDIHDAAVFFHVQPITNVFCSVSNPCSTYGA